MSSLPQIARRLSPRGWAMLGGSALVAIVFLVIVAQMASAPSYSTLETGLDPAQTGKITSTLSTQGIPYQLQNNGTALAVQSDKTAQARIALATAGLLSNQQPGFALMDKQPLGQSNFQQQITYERALEGQLDSTIQTIDGVSSAQVNLVLPNAQDQLFSDNAQPATASVLLSGSSAIDPGSVRGIAQLVASSVPGLQSSKVTITGADGSLLWPTAGSASSGGMPAKQAAEQRYNAAMSAQLNAMLAQTIGAGKAQVVVNANLDANQATSDSLQYAKKGTPLTQQTTREALKGGGSGGAGGAAGVTGNIPAYAQGSAGGNSNYKNQVTDTTYGVNKTVTHTVIAPGTLQSQSVSVLVSSAVPAASIPAIRNAVSSAAGVVPKRDTLTVSQLPFAPTKPAAAAPGAASPTMGYARDGAIALGSLLFLIFAVRLLRRRERESLREPTWLRELQAPRSLAALERREMADPQPTQVMPLQSPVNIARRQVEELAERDPERVAQHLRAWMAED